jgi:hypothetical protein
LVKNRAEIIGNIEQDARQHFRHFLGEFNLVDMVPRIRILLDNMGVWLTVYKIVDARFEVTNVLLSMNKREAGAVGRVRHDNAIFSARRISRFKWTSLIW